ncbi:hypothetical protein [Paeniglutamicibacter cryotolerans]|uniref:Uncharacterized protein n=1 Tax=Paeniglutamicibacter cryotolerans TaxID=670079 RepID=A0A839QQ88_9MICC|nr:hypothetical protein [Paeniglutamicibacter cryotolerans]MBB2996924.1 hypothetical protein [Paeniglutamicibacter cryotolerans]
MLGMKNYTQEYVDASRARIARQIAMFVSGVGLEANPEFEAAYFNNLLVVLDAHFVHRLRGVEKKDGNPLNEVRVICASLLENDELMGSDPAIQLTPEKSVLGLAEGDSIRLNREDFIRLASAFFEELEDKFVASE